MRKITFYLFMLSIGATSCNNRTSKVPNEMALIPKGNMHMVLDSFVRENMTYDTYELYIDKKAPYDYLMTIYAGEFSLTERENSNNDQVSLGYTIVSGKKFNIFSGIEHYFKIKSDIKKEEDVNYHEPYSVWIATDSFNTINIYKGIDFAYPFTPLPKRFTELMFVPPY